MSYEKGGAPAIFVPQSLLVGSGICGNEKTGIEQSQGSSGASSDVRQGLMHTVIFGLVLCGLVSLFV